VYLELKKMLSCFVQYALALSTPEGYQGYGPEQGQMVMQRTTLNSEV
jgi:hypothetical protein